VTKLPTLAVLAILAVTGTLALAGMQRPAALAQASAGLWEISGLPGGKPLRQCITELSALSQFEHRGRTCGQHILRDGKTSVSIEYSCGPADFGRSDVDVLTPRSLRIQTQGIAQGMPFNYLLQARRIGDCPQGH